MSRLIITAVVVAALGAGAYYYLSQPEPTPAEKLEAAADDAGQALNDAAKAVSEAAGSVVESSTEKASELADQAGDAVDSATQQAGEAAQSLSQQAQDQVAALGDQGDALLKSFEEQGYLTEEGFDYDKVVADIQKSPLAEDVKTEAIKILDEIKAAPETLSDKIAELRKLLTQ
ncbi:hypothetical protein FGK63_06305 [Ruegeria sediminis]|uniref:Uncharacterized protein n=1 Tax=Ruegeria sediminis TaxID=2583820 RepID=A0ABY2X1L3_9RHOB|nr:hypothetical protein [Ruegeria sediminis]TMV08728.1 hypothetical protein FGK63_06305 [Ruegeria sediminis]